MVDTRKLCIVLKQERMFIDTEKEQLQRLYEEISQISTSLFQTAWITKQQKIDLNKKILGEFRRKQDGFFDDHNEIGSVSFIESYKHLSYHDGKYGELLKYMKENPLLISKCLVLAEDRNSFDMSHLTSILLSSLYSNCIILEDEQLVLRMLLSLTDLQVIGHENPRHSISRDKCTFNILFKQFCDSLYSAKLFLTASLHDPIMRLLMEDEWFYDIDPAKALVRFPPKERLKRFGKVGTESYENKIKEYRNFVIDKLEMLAARFIISIKSNITCFPSSLKLLLSHVYHSLTKAGNINTQEARLACADLVFKLFICPAICDPEPYGITTDVPISHIACHNLMQMGEILQFLALSATTTIIDNNAADLYGRFEKECMSSFIDDLIQFKDNEGIECNESSDIVEHTGVIISPSHLEELVSFLRVSLENLDKTTPGYQCLEELLADLPAEIHPAAGSLEIKTLTPNLTPNQSPPATPILQRHHSRGLKKGNSNHSLNSLSESDLSKDQSGKMYENPLVIPIKSLSECPGMISEDKFLAEMKEKSMKMSDEMPSKVSDVIPTSSMVALPTVEIQEKRTRFSLSSYQESIGNASDYQEVVSEAASSHSVDNDIDEDLIEENVRDNLSDMVSANVSGRGSPTISGRDTPISQIGSIEDRNISDLSVRVPVTIRKQNREDVTERFGKFEIKTEYERDEAKSTVSDTWSTDVLASDSEPPEQNQLERLVEVVEDMTIQNFPPNLNESDSTFPISEVSETASDAWSTDVLASDNEEKQSESLDINLDHVSKSSTNLLATDLFLKENLEPISMATDFKGMSDTGRTDMSVLNPAALKISRLKGDRKFNNAVTNCSEMDFDSTKDCEEVFLDSDTVIDHTNNDLLDDLIQFTSDNDTKHSNEPTCDSSFDENRLSVALSLFDPLATDYEPSDVLETSSCGSQSNVGVLKAAELKCNVENKMELPESDQHIFDESSVADQKDEHDKKNPNLLEQKDFDMELKLEKNPKKTGLLKSLKDKLHTSIKKRSTKTESTIFNDGYPGIQDINPDIKSEKGTEEESLDEMLNKYRGKKNITNNCNDGITLYDKNDDPKSEEKAFLSSDSHNFESSLTFKNTKRKLWMVLSNSDFQIIRSSSRHKSGFDNDDLVNSLRALLNEAINLQNKSHVAQLHEVIRCVRLFDSNGITRIIKSLHEEHNNRSMYISYLIRCRQGLQSTLSHLQRLLNRTERDREIGTRHLINYCTRRFLEKYETNITKFHDDFQHLTLADEKTDLVERFLEYIYREREQEPIWAAATEWQIEDAHLVIERSVMSRIYTQALFPNGDGDISRDQVYLKHIRKLSENIKPSHPDLCIPTKYHFECPWPAAQREIFLINAYKTPKDKLGCILRCSTTIMNLLSMSNEKSVPAADDFMPVLIYVIIRANPPCLLSTLQYIQSFYDNRLAGEESYWWSQFSSAIEFIKTMEYCE